MTLEPSTTLDIPTGWFGAGPSSVAYEFYGLTLFETSAGYGVAGSDCFSAVPSEQLPEPDADPNNWTLQGSVYTGCRVGTFPATIEIPVNSNAPEALRAKFPAPSALQFVLDGSHVGVFLDAN